MSTVLYASNCAARQSAAARRFIGETGEIAIDLRCSGCQKRVLSGFNLHDSVLTASRSTCPTIEIMACCISSYFVSRVMPAFIVVDAALIQLGDKK